MLLPKFFHFLVWRWALSSYFSGSFVVLLPQIFLWRSSYCSGVSGIFMSLLRTWTSLVGGMWGFTFGLLTASICLFVIPVVTRVSTGITAISGTACALWGLNTCLDETFRNSTVAATWTVSSSIHFPSWLVSMTFDVNLNQFSLRLSIFSKYVCENITKANSKLYFGYAVKNLEVFELFRAVGTLKLHWVWRISSWNKFFHVNNQGFAEFQLRQSWIPANFTKAAQVR